MFIAIKTRFCLPCCRRKNDQNHEFEYFAFYEPGKKHCMSKIPVISCVLRILDGNQAGSNIEREREWSRQLSNIWLINEIVHVRQKVQY